MSLVIGDIQPQSHEDLMATIAAIQTWAGKVEGVNQTLTSGLAGVSAVPTGAIFLWGTNTAPAGYVLLDGAAYSRETYAALYAVFGVTWGAGNGVTTFNVPDLRQRFPLGKAAAGTGATLAGTGGSINHTHTGPSHTHTGPSHTHTFSGTTGNESNATAITLGVNGPVSSFTHDHPFSGTTGSAGTGATGADGTGATSSANPPYVVVNFICKT